MVIHIELAVFQRQITRFTVIKKHIYQSKVEVYNIYVNYYIRVYDIK